jgi:hypothetical protein
LILDASTEIIQTKDVIGDIYMRMMPVTRRLFKECRVLNALKNRFGDHCFVRTIHDSLVESGNGTLLNQGEGPYQIAGVASSSKEECTA